MSTGNPLPESEVGSKQNMKWDDHTQKVFLDVCVEAIVAGYKPTKNITAQGWDWIGSAMAARTGREITKKQLQNKFDSLKKVFSMWKQLLNETGAGWDAELGTVKGDSSWWEAKTKAFKEYKQFRYRGLQHVELYRQIFDGPSRDRSVGWTGSPVHESEPAADEGFQHDESEDFMDNDYTTNFANPSSEAPNPHTPAPEFDAFNVYSTPPPPADPSSATQPLPGDIPAATAFTCPEFGAYCSGVDSSGPPRGRGRTRPVARGRDLGRGGRTPRSRNVGGKRKSSLRSDIRDSVRSISDACWNFSDSATSSLRVVAEKAAEKASSDSIRGCMDAIYDLKDLAPEETIDELVLFGSTIFMDQSVREAFVGVRKPQMKLEWLQRMQELGHTKNPRPSQATP